MHSVNGHSQADAHHFQGQRVFTGVASLGWRLPARLRGDMGESGSDCLLNDRSGKYPQAAGGFPGC